ncbi:NDR1/HIN1-like protein 13 [Nicotiana tomentosiformis]|uniref:NDR1/HIN1-Like protein 3-like n=1 Tax=Nicotiana tabacum TaxID=4097 RepID=A0A1S4CIS8_TOBAC|nr:NDR1/HIN1-like protein 13 [Nicotiana tomentosiformis]XP_016500914.1 PREDICTED: uncharacterized protein LOC107819326 [Nicotiana tabacum]
MEERSQSEKGDGFPQNQITTNNNSPTQYEPLAISVCNTQPPFASGTYVVQVPKDQIYRIPPPENALIVESHRNQNRKPRRSCCYSRRCIYIVVMLVFIGVIIGLIIGLTKLFTKHDDPQFSVKQVLLKKLQLQHKRPQYQYEYDITIEAKNPNQRSRILYYEEDGDVSLYFKQKKIAQGNFPDLDQGPKSSTDIKVILHNGKIDQLPKEVEKNMNSTNSNQHLSLSLSMDVPIKFKVWGISSKRKNIELCCSLTVNTLTKNSHVNNQKCLSKS